MQLFLSKNIPAYMRDYIDYSVEFLGLNRLRGEIHITLHRNNLEEEAYGLCWGNRREAEVQIASRQFGTPLSREEKLKTISHELTHALQYMKGQLVGADVDEWVSRWRGTDMKYTPDEESSMPWELEASLFENEIYESYFESRINKGKR